jgi:excisionase family DNA binding protein
MTQLALRIPDVARALGCSDEAARKMVQRGQLPSRRLGRRVIVLADELRTYLASLEPAASKQ